MTAEGVFLWIFIGGLSGWIAGLLLKGHGFGLVGNIIIGMLGSVVGGWLFGPSNGAIEHGLFSLVAGATIGAIILLLLVRLVNRVA